MNDLGITLLGLAGRVTVLTVVAVALYAAMARRRPGLAALVTALFPAGLLLMTVFAFCPLPAWWAWGEGATESGPDPERLLREELEEAPPAPVLVQGPTPAPAEGAAGWQFGHGWRQVLRALDRAPLATGWRWQAWLACAFLTGGLLGLLRLLLGLWAVRAFRRRSPLIEDDALTQLVDELRAELGCSVVELREGGGLAAPATVGWWRPVVLLPANWPAWNEDDRRAALAHELAHVSRRDYPARLVARLGAVLHFYHPLVWWLMGRLELQQELAADAVAARCVGGSDRYLRALARLALRAAGADRRELALVSMTGTLLRRIAMLQARDGEVRQVGSLWARVVTLGLLAAVALGVSALRCPAEKAKGAAKESAAPVGPVVKEQARGAPAPFDVSFVPASGTGVFAIRPHAFFEGPAMKKYAPTLLSMVNQNVVAGCRAQDLSGPLLPPVESIEQIVGGLELKTLKTKQPGQTALMLSPVLVRTRTDFDWNKLLRAALPGAVEVRHAGKIYLRAPKVAIHLRAFGGTFAFHVVDRRTVLFTDEAQLHAWLEKAPGAGPRPWAADWKQVERGLVALAFDWSDRRWLDQRRQPDENMTADQVALVRKAEGLVFGCDATSKSLRFQGLGRSKTTGDAKALAQAGKKVLAELLKSSEEGEPESAIVQRLVQGLLRGPRIEQEGKLVRWRAEVPVGLADLLPVMGISDER